MTRIKHQEGAALKVTKTWALVTWIPAEEGVSRKRDGRLLPNKTRRVGGNEDQQRTFITWSSPGPWKGYACETVRVVMCPPRSERDGDRGASEYGRGEIC